MRIKFNAYLYLDVPIVITPTLKYKAFNGDYKGDSRPTLHII
jgi:hypothetical protein